MGDWRYRQADLAFVNANVLTLDPARPRAGAVALTGDRVAWVGRTRDLDGLSRRRTEIIDCGGRTVVPGLIDAHCHLLAYASSLLAVDCSPTSVASIAELKAAIGDRARSTPPGGWVRGSGYDELSLREGRRPTRRDLDEAAPDHAVKLSHRSGHACVLNTPGPPHRGDIDRYAGPGLRRHRAGPIDRRADRPALGDGRSHSRPGPQAE